MTDERDLPTIDQIIRKGDTLHGVTMDDDELKDWFEQTIELNKRRRERKSGDK